MWVFVSWMVLWLYLTCVLLIWRLGRHEMAVLSGIPLLFLYGWMDRASIQRISVLWMVLFIGLTAVRIIQLRRRGRALVKLVNDGQLDRYLQEIEHDLKLYSGRAMQVGLRLSQVAGLAYQGRFEESVQILRAIDPRKLNRLFKVVYYNNLIFILLILEQLEEAQALLKSQHRLLAGPHRNAGVDQAIRSTRAVASFYGGDVSTSRRELTALVEAGIPPAMAAVVHYYLGRGYLFEGDREMARRHLEQSSALAGETWFAAQARMLIGNMGST